VSNMVKIILGIIIFLASVFFCMHHREATPTAAAAPVSAPAPARAELQLGERVVLSGEVDSEARRAALVASARSTHGDVVDDRLTVAANTSGQVLTLKGIAADAAARDSMLSSYTQAGGAGFELSNELTVTPTAVAEIKKLLELKNIEFVSGQAVFTAAGKQVADEVAGILGRETALNFEVGGHTDSLGDPAANLALSQARAEAVIQYLSEKGLERSRFTPKGHGSDRPVADNTTREGRQRNRRIEFVQAGG
jgi:outer membrane protein OmpA-like peptidoglycan-associated protein